jgi:hypothetical protein
MVRIAISVEAFEAIAQTLPLGSVGYEAEPNERGERYVWLEDAMADRLGAMRGPGESYSDVILRVAAGRRGLGARHQSPPLPLSPMSQPKGRTHCPLSRIDPIELAKRHCDMSSLLRYAFLHRRPHNKWGRVRRPIQLRRRQAGYPR